MGGQACVFYGAAQFSKDIDFLVLADEGNFDGMHRALAELGAVRIAVPRFDPGVLARGRAVHYRCKIPPADGLRIDIMVSLRDLPPFPVLWERRTTIRESDGSEFQLLSVPDLVAAKKTQREKDWPVISALVENHYKELANQANRDRIAFWLTESRVPERLLDLVARFPSETQALLPQRPLLDLARTNNLPSLRTALDAEMRAEQDKDRRYWEPLKRELEEFRRLEREG